MRILVTGREGQVARSLAERGGRHELAAGVELRLLEVTALLAERGGVDV